MGKKRKSVATSLDEVDKTMHATFCSAANSLSQLYTHAMNHQKLSFLAGERHALEKLYQWISMQQDGGSRVTSVDIITYLQSELEYYGEEPSVSSRTPLQNQHSQPTLPNSGFPVDSGSSGVLASVHGLRSEHHDQQSRNYIFPHSLSGPIHRVLQNCTIGEGGHYPNGVQFQPSANGIRGNESNFVQHQNRANNPLNSNDSSMDMHSDSIDHESTF